jgi:CBS-domain-containing membrane protein
MTPMIDRNAHRLTIYIGESDRWRGKPLYAALLETLKAEGVAGATVVRGVAGFGAHSRIHTAAILRLSEDLPLRIEVIDSPDKIAHAIEVITPMVREGLITLDEVQVAKYTHRYLNPLPADRPVEEIMTRDAMTLNPEMTVAQAWERMLEHQIKALPVVTGQGEVVGMLTDEDILECCGGLQQRLAIAERLDEEILREELENLRTSPLKVGDVMKTPAITIKASDPLGLAAARMARHGIKRLPVVDEMGKLVGVLSRVDILQQVVETLPRARKSKLMPGAVHVIREVMSPRVPLIDQDALLPDVITAFIEYDTRRLIVVDQEGRPVGLVSDADAVSRVQPQERRGVLSALRRRGPMPSGDVTAGELMSRGVLTVGPQTDVAEAVRSMLSHRRKWLVVVDEEGRPMGLVDRQILLQAVSGK